MTDDVTDPFEDSEYNLIQFVQLSRIYDTLMTLVMIQNPTAAENLLNAHATGDLVNPSPNYTGKFLFDDLNFEGPEQDVDEQN